MICSKVPYRVLLLWYMEGDNFGDVMIFQTVRNFIESMGIRVEEHEVGAPCNVIIDHANKCDFLLFAGGGIIERGVPNVIRYFEEDYPLLKVPYGVMGLGMGTFDYSKYFSTIAFWVKHAAFFYVRDVHTKNLLNQIAGINKAVYSADCVFYSDIVSAISRRNNRVIGVNVRDVPYPDLTGELDWIRMNKELQACKCDYLIPDSSDEMEKLMIPLKNWGIIESYNNMTREEKKECTISVIKECDYVIAMRFHVILVAALAGAIPIPIIYCPKVRFLAEQLGIEDLAMEVEQYELIPQKINKAIKDHDAIKNRIKENVFIMKKRAEEMFENIRQGFCSQELS